LYSLHRAVNIDLNQLRDVAFCAHVIEFVAGRCMRLGLGAAMFRAFAVLAICGAVCACTTVDAGKGGATATYFGIVRIETPASTGGGGQPVIATDARGFGLRLHDGIGAGYFHDQDYQVPPDCRVVIFVQTQEQLDQLSNKLADFKEGICGTVKSS
jgi:hypothetical protein